MHICGECRSGHKKFNLQYEHFLQHFLPDINDQSRDIYKFCVRGLFTGHTTQFIQKGMNFMTLTLYTSLAVLVVNAVVTAAQSPILLGKLV